MHIKKNRKNNNHICYIYVHKQLTWRNAINNITRTKIKHSAVNNNKIIKQVFSCLENEMIPVPRLYHPDAIFDPIVGVTLSWGLGYRIHI